MAENGFCTNCGAPRTPGEDFCTNCGTRYDEQTADEAATAPLPAAAASPTPAAAAAPGAPPTKKRNRTPLLIGIASVLVIALVAGLVYFLRDDAGPGEQGSGVEHLSFDQDFVQEVLGDPPFFTLSMAGAEGAGRYDTWYYVKDGVQFDFFDGAYAGSIDIPVLTTQSTHIDLAPGDFERGMSLQEVTDLVGAEPLETLGGPEGELVGFPGLRAGFQDGGLVYVATVPYFTDSGLPQFVPVSYHAPAPVRGQVLAGVAPEAVTAGVLDGLWRLWERIKQADKVRDTVEDAKTGISLATIIALQGELNEMIRFAEGKIAEMQAEAQRFEQANPPDPVQAQRYRNAEAELRRAVALGNGWKAEIDRLRSAGAALDAVFNPTPVSVVNAPDAATTRKAFDDYLKARSGRPGQVRQQLEEWGNQLTTSWNDLPDALKRSIVTDTIQVAVTRKCPDRNAPDYGDCAARTLIEIKNKLRGQGWPTATTECIDEINRLLQGGGLQLIGGAGFGGPLGVGFVLGQLSGTSCPVRKGDSEAGPTPTPTGEATPTIEPTVETPTDDGQTETGPPPPSSTLRVKVTTTLSCSVDDEFANSVGGVEVRIGEVSVETIEGDPTRTTVPAGTHYIQASFDFENPDEQEYVFGSVNISGTEGSFRYEGNSPLGDVPLTFNADATRPGSESDYEVAVRMVDSEPANCA